MGDEQGRFLLFEGGDHLTSGMQKLAELATKYPESDLAKYANFSLGIRHLTEFADFTKKQVRQPDTKKSMSHFKAAKPKLHGYYARKAYFTLASLYDKSNNKSAKKNTLNEFVDRFSSDSKYSDSVSKAKSMLEDSSEVLFFLRWIRLTSWGGSLLGSTAYSTPLNECSDFLAPQD